MFISIWHYLRGFVPTFVLALFLALNVAKEAQAIIFEADYLIHGDRLITVDTNTKRDWLDLSLSLGNSYNDMVGAANLCNPYCATGPFKGWYFATEALVLQLFSDAGLPIYDASLSHSSPEGLNVRDFIIMVGGDINAIIDPTYGYLGDRWLVSGITGTIRLDETVIDPTVEWFGVAGCICTGTYTDIGIEKNTGEPFRGVWLWRPSQNVPEPSSMVLVGLGLAAAVFVIRRRI